MFINGKTLLMKSLKKLNTVVGWSCILTATFWLYLECIARANFSYLITYEHNVYVQAAEIFVFGYGFLFSMCYFYFKVMKR